MAFANIDSDIENLNDVNFRELYIAIHSAVITFHQIELLRNKSILEELEKENEDHNLDGAVNNFRAIYELSALQIYQYEKTFKKLIENWDSSDTYDVVISFIKLAKEKYASLLTFELNNY
jgi:hypothetical protein